MLNEKNTRLITYILSIILLFTMIFSTVNENVVYGMSGNSSDNSAQVAAVTALDDSTSPPAVVTPVSITTVQMNSIATQPYKGKAIKPTVVLTYAGQTLVQNVDYQLTYSNNVNPGTATIRVDGIGNYFDSLYANFKIIVATPKSAKIKGDQKKITFSWKKVKAVSGYEVYWASNKKFTKKKKMKRLKSQKKNSYSIKSPVTKKTYYMKVRAYKIINGKRKYSKFSTVKVLKFKNQKWIEVDLSEQKIYLKKGKKVVKTYVVSTGKKKTPTIKGTFYIYNKNPKHDMIGRYNPEKKGPDYIQKDVLWATYFKGGYAFHATYWHNNFGQPMSHGCVNMKTKQAKFLYKWAPMGTRVVVHK